MSWIGIGGCLLGLLGVQRVWQRSFPGEPLFGIEAWWRTRRREILRGRDSENRVPPVESFAILESVFPDLHELASSLSQEEPNSREVRVRKILFETEGGIPRAALLCFLAEIVGPTEGRDRGRELLREADAVLGRVWEPLNPLCDRIAQRVSLAEIHFLLQEGLCEEGLHALEEAEARFGQHAWIREYRAEFYLVQGETEACRSQAEALLNLDEIVEKAREISESSLTGLLLLAESYLRDGDLDRLEKTLKRVGPRRRLSDPDLAVYARLQLERLLLRGNLAGAWRQVGTLSRLVDEHRCHPGFNRTLQLACSRIHSVEGNLRETGRRLGTALNCSGYPVARWEVKLQIGMVLEAEGRFAEAASVWEELQEEAVGTYFARLAAARSSRLPEQEEADPVPKRYAGRSTALV